MTSSPDRSGAGHEHTVVGCRARERDRVQRHRGRLDQRGLPDRQVVGHREQLVGRGDDVARVRAAEVEVVGERSVEAHRRPAGAARAARAAARASGRTRPGRRSASPRRRRRAPRSCPPTRGRARCPGRAIRSSTRCTSVPQMPHCPTSTSTSRRSRLRHRHLLHLEHAVADVHARVHHGAHEWSTPHIRLVGPTLPRSRATVPRDTGGDGEVHAWLHRAGQGGARSAAPAGAVRHRRRSGPSSRPRRRRRSTPPRGRSPSRATSSSRRRGPGTRCTRSRRRRTRATSTASPRGRSSGWSSRACRSTPSSRSPARSRRQPRRRVLVDRVHHQPPARRRHRRQGVGRVHRRRLAALPRSRRSRAAPRAPPLLLEERQVGVGPPGARPRRARVLGAQRLPRPRRSLARAALPGRLTVPAVWQSATVVAVHDETPRAEDPPPAARRRPTATAPASTTSCGSPRPTATRRPARTRWRHRPTAATSSSSPSSGSTTARCRRSSTTCWRSATSSRCAARSAGTSCGTGRRPALLARRRLRRRAAHGDAAARPRRTNADRDTGRRTRAPRSCRCARPTTSTTPTSSPTRRRHRALHARAHRPRGRGPAGRLGADDIVPHLRDDQIDLRVRVGTVHRRGRRPARRARRRTRTRALRTVRPERVGGPHRAGAARTAASGVTTPR